MPTRFLSNAWIQDPECKSGSDGMQLPTTQVNIIFLDVSNIKTGSIHS